MELLHNPRGLANTTQMVYDDFPPSSDWTQDSNCHVLLIDLPGFKREELKVRVDNLRKVTVSGERQVSENRYSRFKQVYELPEDSDIDNISGRFDGGLLFIIIPKKKVEGTQQPETEIQSASETEDQRKYENPSKEDEKREEPKNEEVDKHNHEKKDEHSSEESNKDDDDNSHVLHNEKKKEESKRTGEKGGLIREENEKKEESKRTDGKEGLIREGRKKMDEDWRKLTERAKNKEELEVLMKTTIEKIKNNKAMIITAVLAFSIGLYISRKFQSGGQ